MSISDKTLKHAVTQLSYKLGKLPFETVQMIYDPHGEKSEQEACIPRISEKWMNHLRTDRELEDLERTSRMFLTPSLTTDIQ